VARDEHLGARHGRTQSMFRDVNERVRKINTDFGVPLGDWVCECADSACTERIALTAEEYEAIRANPRRFAVASSYDHVVREVEKVVEQEIGFWVVEKGGPAGELAVKVDPRRVGHRGHEEATA
jgi:hypothetical protein